MIRAFDDPVRERVRVGERGDVVRDRGVRNDLVVLGFDHQRIAEELRAGAQRAVVLGAQGEPPVRGEVRVDVQLALGLLPVVVLVERRGAQGEPADRPKVQKQRAEVRAVARADHRDR